MYQNPKSKLSKKLPGKFCQLLSSPGKPFWITKKEKKKKARNFYQIKIALYRTTSTVIYNGPDKIISQDLCQCRSYIKFTIVPEEVTTHAH